MNSALSLSGTSFNNEVKGIPSLEKIGEGYRRCEELEMQH